MVAFTVNGQRQEVSVDGNTPLLWVLREHLKLTGTKFGCGIASCGACTVHIDGEAVRSCAMPVSLVAGKSITTIEGLSHDGSHPLQKAWIAEQVPQRQMLPSMCSTISAREGFLLCASSAAACMICPDWQ